MKTLFLKDIGALQLDKKERILYFLLLFFFFALYMPGITWLYNVSMYLFFVYSFFFNSISQKWRLLKQRKELLFILIFFLLNFSSALLSTNQKEGISFAGIRISLFVIPVAIGTIYIKNILKQRLIYGFAVATTCAAFGCVIWGAYRSVKFNDWSLLYNDNLSDIVNLQSIYFAMLINLTIFSFVYLWLKSPAIINKNVLIPVLIILLVVNFLLASRMAIIILYSSSFIFAMVNFIRQKKILQGATLVLGLLLAAFLLLNFFPKTINRFKELSYTKFDFKSMAKESHFNAALTPEQWNGANIRIAVWQCAWAVIKTNIIFGTGLGDKMEELKKAYTEKGFLFGSNSSRNTHNNYLDVWMSLGLAGIIVLLIGFIILPLFNCAQSGDWYGFIIVVCFMLAMLVENYMDRTMGNTILAFFLSFITAYKKPFKNIDHKLSSK